jgi:hypothetical protein
VWREKQRAVINESLRTPAAPRSLYEAQLALRFGGRQFAWVEKAEREQAAMQENR